MQLFYTPEITRQQYFLNEEESKHCIKVLRKAEGDTLHLIDGVGGFYTAVITQANAKKCSFRITASQQEYGKRNNYLHIALAPTKNTDRFEWFLEKATELGIDEITPLLCDNSERKVIKPARLEKVIISAMKQSLKAYKPVLNELTTFTHFLNKCQQQQKCIAHCNESEARKTFAKLSAKQNNEVVLIGPEGDFSCGEIKQALQQGYTEISLGATRLRTETAGITACCISNFTKL